MAAWYNEHDKFAAAWLRELIKEGLIADGEVDERSIVDVQPDDLRGFVQCHFFAGIGGWSLALRLAGWPDTRPIWSGSCPCQPFSAAGRQTGGDDSRHLWPAWARLIRECRPDHIIAEQVESALGHGWFDLVSDDLENEGYAIGACCLPGPVCGAYDIRQRLWFVAKSERAEWRALGFNRIDGRDGQDAGRQEAHGESGARGEVRALAESERGRRVIVSPTRLHAGRPTEGRAEAAADGADGAFWDDVDGRRVVGRLADADRRDAREHAGKLSSDEGSHEEWATHGDHASVDHGAIGESADASGSNAGWLADAEQRRDRGEADATDSGASQTDRPADQHRRHRGTSGLWAISGRDGDECDPPGGLADAEGARPPYRGTGAVQPEPRTGGRETRKLADADAARRGAGRTGEARNRLDAARIEFAGLRHARFVADATHGGFGIRGGASWPTGHAHQRDTSGGLAAGRQAQRRTQHAGFWADAEWLPCRDGKMRPTESVPQSVADGLPSELGYLRTPGTPRAHLSPLVSRAPNRVGRLRGYGNAIKPPLAAAFIQAYMETLEDP